MSRPLLFGSLLAVSVLAASPALAGDACTDRSAGNNPAFTQPKPCPPTAKKAKSTDSDLRVEKRDGATVYGFGDTSVAVSGYVRSDTAVRRWTGR